MARSCRYSAKPQEIRAYLENSGYTTKERLHADGVTPGGFHVVGTTVFVGYDLIVEGRLWAHGLIGLHNNPLATDPEVAERSRKLYERLYRRFGVPGRKAAARNPPQLPDS